MGVGNFSPEIARHGLQLIIGNYTQDDEKFTKEEKLYILIKGDIPGYSKPCRGTQREPTRALMPDPSALDLTPEDLADII